MGAKSATIRHARPRDAPALAALAAATFGDTHRMLLNDADDAIEAHVATHFTIEAVASWIADPASTLLVAAARGRLFGYAQLRDKTPPACVDGPDPIELARIYLDTDAIGTGLGARLMEAAYAEARTLHRGTLWLVVCEGNLRAIRFYTKSGFAPAGHTEFMLGGRRYLDPVLAAPVPAGGRRQ